MRFTGACFLFILNFVLSATVYSDSEVDQHTIRCTQLRDLSEKVMDELSKTNDRSYTGGNSNWEHSNLVDYEDSEVRFNDVFSHSCSKVGNPALCYEIVESHDEQLLSWWKKGRLNGENLYDDFFVKELKMCCLSGFYGESCESCKGLVDGKVCNGHGSCNGDGSRVGDGSCKCNSNYEGAECDACVEGYYIKGNRCAKCDSACLRGCTGGRPQHCLHGECDSGYVANENGGCDDVNECLNASTCPSDKYCVNHIGAHNCISCNKACKTCTGVTNLHCIACADGFERVDGRCIEVAKESETADDYECDKACKTCTAAGANNCVSCADGYTLQSGVCTEVGGADKESDELSESKEDESKIEHGESKDKESEKDKEAKKYKKEKKSEKDKDEKKYKKEAKKSEKDKDEKKSKKEAKKSKKDKDEKKSKKDKDDEKSRKRRDEDRDVVDDEL